MGSTSSAWPRATRPAVVLVLAGLAGLAVLAVLACSRVDPHAGGASPAAGMPALRVGTSGDYAPFSLWPEDEDEPRGFSIDVARAFARSRGQQLEWIRFRWPELAAELAAEHFDLALSGITIRPDRSLAGRFSLPLTETGAVALVRADSDLHARGDLDRPSIRIAVNRGGHLERVARTLFPNARIEAIAVNDRVPDALGAGRADAALTDDLEAPHWQARLPETRAIGPLTRDRKAAWFPPARGPLAREFDRWLLQAESTGELARLRQRHGIADLRTAGALPALLASLDERLSLMPAVARAKHVLALPIEDRAQEERVHAAASRAVDRAARECGCAPPAPAVLRRFVDVQLRAARAVQERERAGLTNESAALPNPESARRALDLEIRPALAYVTDRIAWLVVANSPAAGAKEASGPAERLVPDAVSQALARHRLPPGLEAELQSALEALVTDPPHARRASPAPPLRGGSRGIAPNG